MGRRSRFLPLLVAGTCALALVDFAGCSKHHEVTAPPALVPPPPDPVSPQAAMRLFQWAWNFRDVEPVRELLTADFSFVFAGTDTAGGAFLERSLDRDQFLRCVYHLFVGGGAEPPAERIVLIFDPHLVAMPDSRPGKMDLWHKEIRTSVDLTVDAALQTYRITGYVRVFLVRGDSAAIPADLVARGFKPDSTRWYIERWGDETDIPWGAMVATVRPLRALPAKKFTWGRLLMLYLPPGPPA